jgi:hypothetical protein
MLEQTIPMVMAAVFRKLILQDADYPARIGLAYDHWLAYLAVKDGQAVYYVPRRLTRYRLHANSGTAMGDARRYRDSLFVRNRFEINATMASCLRKHRNELGILYGKLGLHYLSKGMSRRGGVLVRKAFRLLNRPKNMVALAVNTIKARHQGKVR